MSYPSPAHALAAIAKELGAEGLVFDKSGIARIAINDQIVVAFAKGVREDCIDIVAEVPIKLEEMTSQIASNMLLANFRCGGPGLPTFSINPTDGTVLLSNSLRTNRTDLPELMAAFKSFTRVLFHYHNDGLRELREESLPTGTTVN